MTLPLGWQFCTLRDLGVQAQSGFASGKHNSEGRGVLHLRPMNVSRDAQIDLSDCRWVDDETDRRIAAGDVLFNNTNSPALVGKTAVVRHGGPYAYSNHMTRLRPNPDLLDPPFLAMQLYSMWMDGLFERICSNHVNQASVATRRLLEVGVVVPPLAEQRRIVEILEDQLSRLDAAVRYLGSALEKSIAMHGAVLQSAISGMLSEHSASTINRQRLLEARRRTCPVDMKRGRPDPSAPLAVAVPWPEHWVTMSLEEVTHPVRTISYGILKPGPNMDGGVPYVRVLNMRGDQLDVNSLHRTSPEIAASYARANLETDDLLISIRGTYGRVVRVPASLAGANITQDTARLAFLPSVDPDFAAIVLRSPFTQHILKRVARGVAVKGVNIADLRGVPFPVPPLQEQTRIVSGSQEVLSKLGAAQMTAKVGLRRAQTLRRTLLNAAFTGELTPPRTDAIHSKETDV